MKMNRKNRLSSPPGYFAEERPEMRRFIPRQARRVLDCGCGEGAFAQWIRESLRAEVWGVEQEPRAGQCAAKVLDRLIVGDIVEVIPALPDGYFDCIIFNDVLEHLLEPDAALRAVRSKLAPGGVVVASIPNVRFIHVLCAYVLRGHWRYTARGICDTTHVRFFTRSSIIELFEETGMPWRPSRGSTA